VGPRQDGEPHGPLRPRHQRQRGPQQRRLPRPRDRRHRVGQDRVRKDQDVIRLQTLGGNVTRSVVVVVGRSPHDACCMARGSELGLAGA